MTNFWSVKYEGRSCGEGALWGVNSGAGKVPFLLVNIISMSDSKSYSETVAEQKQGGEDLPRNDITALLN